MKQELPISAWLDVLSAVMPARGTLVVGAGAGTSPWLQWLRSRGARPVWMVEGDDAQYRHLVRHVPHAQGWMPRPDVVTKSKVPVEFFRASNPAESGLIPVERLRGLWANLSTISTVSVDQTVTLDTLFADVGGNVNWLVLDCLPAAHLLTGAEQLLRDLDVAVVRVVHGGVVSDSGVQREEVHALLQEAGFACVHFEAGRHPALGHVIFVRDTARQTAAIARLRVELEEAQIARARAEAALSQQIEGMQKRAQAYEREVLGAEGRLEQIEETLRAEREVWLQTQNSVEQAMQQAAVASAEKIQSLEARVKEVTAMLAKVEKAGQQQAQEHAQTEKERGERALQTERELRRKERETLVQAHDRANKLAEERRAQVLALEKRIWELQSSAEENNAPLIRDELVKAEQQISLLKELLFPERKA